LKTNAEISQAALAAQKENPKISERFIIR